MVRRDRSLGGKEVVVGIVEKERVDARKRKSFGILDNPLSMPKSRMVDGLGRMLKNPVRWAKKLPSWWPSSAPQQSPVVDKEYYQGEADRLVRGLFVSFFLSFLTFIFMTFYGTVCI